MLESEVLKFFPEPVFKYKFEKAEFFNNELAQYIYNLQKEDLNGLTKSNRGGWHSKDFKLTDQNSIHVSANNPEKEEGEESISCEYTGEKIDIAFNVNYLQEILSTLDSENIEINFFGSDKSCLITDPGSSNLKYVVMPLLI